MHETKMTAALPSLDMEVVHREHPEERAESMTIRLVARPDFETATGVMLPLLTARLASFSGPFSLPAAGPMANPLAFWTSMVQAVWAPWLQLCRTPLLPPGPKSSDPGADGTR